MRTVKRSRLGDGTNQSPSQSLPIQASSRPPSLPLVADASVARREFSSGDTMLRDALAPRAGDALLLLERRWSQEKERA